ncbi:hypothetical protein C1645_732398 [Glomus cerebriforme]|uniref:BTB/POZ domain-containing protein n=1 Tax=Glomus cerebriforme TaxID=658196 RepID=A0A397TM81_9GLOM|nr:hypothetical protein C1645_732398 [Glomus cerebriforme]
MNSKLYLPILNNFENLYKSKFNYDVIIQAGDGNDQKEIYVHSIVLSCQSNYFDAALSVNWGEKESGKYIFKKPNISPHIFEIIFRYLYCGKINLDIMDTLDIFKLSIATDELRLNTIFELVKNFLITSRLNEIFELASRDKTYVACKNYCLEIICKEPYYIFGNDKLLSLPAQILETILKRDDLMLDEIEVWNSLIKWAHAQHPTINKDPFKWTMSNLILMKKTLSNFIPLIRFHDITQKKYYEKVIPYENLLSRRLKLEISKFHFVSNIKQIGLLPSRFICKLDSIIINSKFLTLFTGWIDKRNKASKLVSYKFNLILRGSHDGFDAKTFHKNCDYRGATIFIAKIKGMNRIIGGYNPLDWSGNCGYKNSSNSFIFSFENINDININNINRIGRVIEKKYAVYCNTLMGPCFGKFRTYGKNDLTMNFDGIWSSTKSTYPYLNIPRNFEVDDYEVFQIIKKRNKKSISLMK